MSTTTTIPMINCNTSSCYCYLVSLHNLEYNNCSCNQCVPFFLLLLLTSAVALLHIGYKLQLIRTPFLQHKSSLVQYICIVGLQNLHASSTTAVHTGRGGVHNGTNFI